MIATQTNRPLPLGQTFTTPGYLALFEREPEDMQPDTSAILSRHVAGDWGDLDADDKQANDEQRHDEAGHVLSLYHVKGERVYIETCWNGEGYRTTCVMLPEER